MALPQEDIEGQTERRAGRQTPRQHITPNTVRRIFMRLVYHEYKTVYKGTEWQSCFKPSHKGLALSTVKRLTFYASRLM